MLPKSSRKQDQVAHRGQGLVLAQFVDFLPAMPRSTRERMREQRDVKMKDRPGVTFISSSKYNRQVLDVPASVLKKRKRKVVAAGKVVRQGISLGSV